MTDRQIEIRRRLNLAPYLAQLSVIANREVAAEEIGTFGEMEAFRARCSALRRDPDIRFIIPFEQRLGSEFTSFVARLRQLNPAPVHVWIDHTNDCGLLELPDVGEVNFAFPFDLDPNRMIVLTTTDSLDMLTLIRQLDRSNRQILYIEVTGQNWPKAGQPLFPCLPSV